MDGDFKFKSTKTSRKTIIKCLSKKKESTVRRNFRIRKTFRNFYKNINVKNKNNDHQIISCICQRTNHNAFQIQSLSTGLEIIQNLTELKCPAKIEKNQGTVDFYKIYKNHNFTKINFPNKEEQGKKINHDEKVEVRPDISTRTTNIKLHLIHNIEPDKETDLVGTQYRDVNAEDCTIKIIEGLSMVSVEKYLESSQNIEKFNKPNDKAENVVETFQSIVIDKNNDPCDSNIGNQKIKIIKEIIHDCLLPNNVHNKLENNFCEIEIPSEISKNDVITESELDHKQRVDEFLVLLNNLKSLNIKTVNSNSQISNITKNDISNITYNNTIETTMQNKLQECTNNMNTREMDFSEKDVVRKGLLQGTTNTNKSKVFKSDGEPENDLDHQQRVIEFLSLLKNLKSQSIYEDKNVSKTSIITNNKSQVTEEENPKPITFFSHTENHDSHSRQTDQRISQISMTTCNITDEKNNIIERANLKETRSTCTDTIRKPKYILPHSPKSMNLRSCRILIAKQIELSYSYSEEEYEEQVEKPLPSPKPMDWKTYHRLDVINNFLDELESNYPSLCSVHVIGQSREGRCIKILKISNSQEDNASVWIDAGMHAREWIAPAVNTYVANYIAKNFKSLPEYMTNVDWYFLPVANPDGYEYSHTDNRLWRKNKACIGNQCFGVDLNRNFSYGWGCAGSSSNPSHSFYRGLKPFSEPETLAIKNAILNSGIKFKVYLTLHCFGQKIIFPFACKEELCPHYIRLLRGAAVISKAIFETNGNIYKAGTSKDMMYRASGTSQDWCYGVARVPYCYLIELCEKKHKFKMPAEDIEAIGNEILSSVKALMEFVYKQPLEENEACLHP